MASQTMFISYRSNYAAESVVGMHMPQTDEMKEAAKQRLIKQIALAKASSANKSEKPMDTGKIFKKTNKQNKWQQDSNGNWIKKI